MIKKDEVWIQKGYTIFALFGDKGLSIEQMAKEVGISKSSFYHRFGDLEVFIERLLLYHVDRSNIIAEKERNAKRINPDLINILVDHKIDLLFNRQLRVNSCRSRYKETLLESTRVIGNDFIKLWLLDTKIDFSLYQAEGFFELAIENFFMQINIENLNAEWLVAYFEQLNRISRSL
jgi:AcrR family transcriptional regulator